MKMIFVRFRGLRDHSSFEFWLVPIPPELTVSEFKSLWGHDSESVVYAPSCILPLSETERLYNHVHNGDTVTVASSWLNAPAPGDSPPQQSQRNAVDAYPIVGRRP